MEITKLKICLAKKMVIFYAVLALLIIPASIYNLIGVINHTNSIYHLGAFSLFGFVILPMLIFSKYRNNLCIIKGNEIQIGKCIYGFSNHRFSIKAYELPLSDRPIISLLKKKYFRLVIYKIKTNVEVFVEDLDITKSDIKRIESLLPK